MDEEDVWQHEEGGALGGELVVPRDTVLAVTHKALVVQVRRRARHDRVPVGCEGGAP
jgi:hypothetical protein